MSSVRLFGYRYIKVVHAVITEVISRNYCCYFTSKNKNTIFSRLNYNYLINHVEMDKVTKFKSVSL